MKLQVATVFLCLVGTSVSLPIYPQIGMFASNSNEILRLNGLTLTGLGYGQAQVQGSQFLPQYVLQQQQPPQVLTFNPQMGGFNPQMPSFLPQGPQLLLPPNQANQLPPHVYPNAQQEQAGPVVPQDPNAPQLPQPPPQMIPQYYPSFNFPQQQVYPNYLPYGYPQQRNPQYQPTLTNGQAQQQQNLEKTTQTPQLPLQQPAQPNGHTEKTQAESSTPPPDHRGDTAGFGIDEGHPNFSFLFKP